MIKKRCLFLIIFLIFSVQLFAMGARGQETPVRTQNDEWILCITDFDIKSLPAEKVIIAGVITRKLVERLDSINYRTRISPEYAYYEEHAWARARSTAAKALSARMDERSRQIYLGDPNWKFRQNIKRLDTDIERLRTALEEIDNNAPLINKEPVFKLTSGNINLNFPAPPEAGNEFRFCTTQRADAFLVGSVTDFHGRYYLSVKLYTVYTRSFVWEENIIFSHYDLEAALDDITRRLIIVLSGNPPAAIAVKAVPDDTLVLINRTFAGRGETSLTEYPPGNVIITASAPNHDSITIETELNAGEYTEINIRLNPVEFGVMEISGDQAGSIYHGALYVGRAPFTLRLPINQMEYVEMEAFNGHKGSIVFRTPDMPEYSQSVNIRTERPLQKGRVNRERKIYYWAWGGQWISGIAAWIGYYTYLGTGNAYMYSYNNKHDYQKLQNDFERAEKFMIGSLATFGAFCVYGTYRMVRYLVIASKGSTPIVQPEKN
ncbi:MAG: carboxypeptidase-like regulatory domain-containing protein [Treponema sp.]|nr:carboxypeptidase-like regulatory domain-containing protein [Treponema sp.]